jgi:hypothetical protein
MHRFFIAGLLPMPHFKRRTGQPIASPYRTCWLVHTVSMRSFTSKARVPSTIRPGRQTIQCTVSRVSTRGHTGEEHARRIVSMKETMRSTCGEPKLPRCIPHVTCSPLRISVITAMIQSTRCRRFSELRVLFTASASNPLCSSMNAGARFTFANPWYLVNRLCINVNVSFECQR